MFAALALLKRQILFDSKKIDCVRSRVDFARGAVNDVDAIDDAKSVLLKSTRTELFREELGYRWRWTYIFTKRNMKWPCRSWQVNAGLGWSRAILILLWIRADIQRHFSNYPSLHSASMNSHTCPWFQHSSKQPRKKLAKCFRLFHFVINKLASHFPLRST